jgi:hypothetical protein
LGETFEGGEDEDANRMQEKVREMVVVEEQEAQVDIQESTATSKVAEGISFYFSFPARSMACMCRKLALGNDGSVFSP